jgi:hypothetical protein
VLILINAITYSTFRLVLPRQDSKPACEFMEGCAEWRCPSGQSIRRQMGITIQPDTAFQQLA